MKGAVLNGLGEMGGADGLGAGEVGDRAGHPQDAADGAGRETEALRSRGENRSARGVKSAEAADLLIGHRGVAAA